MQGDKIHILSTSEIPSFKNDHSTIIFDILSFQQIEMKNDPLIAQRVKELAGLDYFAIFTSSNAVKAVSKFLEGSDPAWKCFCVGKKTAENLQSAFYKSSVLATADNAVVLAKNILALRPSPLIFFSGNLRRDELPDHLKMHDLTFEELQVYTTNYKAANLSRKYDGVLFFSPGAVNVYFDSYQPDSHTVMFAIGTTTASTLREKTTNKILTTDRPDKAALAKLALQYFEENLS